MSEIAISKTESSESPSSKKPKLGDESPAASSPASCALLLSSFGYGSAGVKSHMEDAHIMFDDLWSVLPSSMKPVQADACSFYGVFDGHGGDACARFVASELPVILAKRMLPPPADVDSARAALMTAYQVCMRSPVPRLPLQYLTHISQEVECAWMQTPSAAAPSPSDSGGGRGSGCCAVTLLIYKGTGLVAWLGDARCVLARREKGKDESSLNETVGSLTSSPKSSDKLNAFALTKDHKAVILKEKQRIEKAGGFVSDGRVCGIMEVSRSIGDAALKSKGVSSVPETTRITLTQRDNFFVLACDGLWRVFDNSQAVEFVSRHVQKQKQDDDAGVLRDNADVAMALVREAIRGRQALDNVSAVVVMLGW